MSDEESIWAGKLDNLNKWYEHAKLVGEESVTAIEIINELLKYAMQFCDAEDVLTKVDQIAKARMEFIRYG